MEGGAAGLGRAGRRTRRGFSRRQPIVGEDFLGDFSPSLAFAFPARALGPGALSGRWREEAALPLPR